MLIDEQRWQLIGKSVYCCMHSTPRPPRSQLYIYAIGQFGWSLASFGAANLLVYFYMPPEEAGQSAVFPPMIFQGAILGIVTIIGLINFGGRLFDAITDPLIAASSDRASTTGGKRRKFMKWAAVPFAVLSVLIFCPPIPGESIWNSVWLVGMILLFYFFLTLYVVPYNALISELGHHPPDRMRISTLISIAWAMGFVLGGTAYGLQGYFEQSVDAVTAFQYTVAVYGVVALLAMLCPAFFLKEETYAKQTQASQQPIRLSLRTVLSDRPFRVFVFSDLMYWIALTFIQQGVSYYVTTVFGLPKEQATTFLMVSFLGSFALYWPINVWVKRAGKRLPLLFAFWAFFLVFSLTALIRPLGLPAEVFFYVLAALSAFPLAAFGIIPNALIADFIHRHEQQTGTPQAGMFYAVRNFMMKVGITVASLIFPSMLLLGRSAEEPTGVLASAWVACGFCVLGWWLFRRVGVIAPSDNV